MKALSPKQTEPNPTDALFEALLEDDDGESTGNWLREANDEDSDD